MTMVSPSITRSTFPGREDGGGGAQAATVLATAISPTTRTRVLIAGAPRFIRSRVVWSSVLVVIIRSLAGVVDAR